MNHKDIFDVTSLYDLVNKVEIITQKKTIIKLKMSMLSLKPIVKKHSLGKLQIFSEKYT